MRDYKYNYRTLSGWECFEAEGKLCHHDTHKSMILFTGSSNYGHGICCKPDNFDGICNNEGPLTCSQPSFAFDTYPGYMNVLTNGMFNN